MNKIVHQVRAEHRIRILNECKNSVMSKLSGVEKMGFLRSNSFTGSIFCAGKPIKLF